MSNLNFISDINIRNKLYKLANNLVLTIINPFSFIKKESANVRDGGMLSVFSLLSLTLCTYVPTAMQLGVNNTRISFIFLSLVALYFFILFGTMMIGMIFTLGIPSRVKGTNLFSFNMKDKLKEMHQFFAITIYQTARNVIFVFLSLFFLNASTVGVVIIFNLSLIIISVLSTTIIIKSIKTGREVAEISLTLIIFMLLAYYSATHLLIAN